MDDLRSCFVGSTFYKVGGGWGGEGEKERGPWSKGTTNVMIRLYSQYRAGMSDSCPPGHFQWSFQHRCF